MRKQSSQPSALGTTSRMAATCGSVSIVSIVVSANACRSRRADGVRRVLIITRVASLKLSSRPVTVLHPLQVLVDELDRHRPFADRGRDPFDRPAAHVSGREHAGTAGLEQERLAPADPG
jgi:hypothetical protein